MQSVTFARNLWFNSLRNYNDLHSEMDPHDLNLNEGHGLSVYHDEDRKKGGFWKLKDSQIFLSEYIGTFILAFFVSASKTSDNPLLIPFAVGGGLIALIHVFGPISGGQFNPAATLALFLRYKLNTFEGVYCVISQCLGSLSAGMITNFMYNGDWNSVGYPKVVDPTKRPQAFLGEALLTYALMAVALNTATTNAQANNSYFGIAIGFVVIAGALVLGGVSGACFNPALGLLAVQHGAYNDMWVFVLAPLCGALLAGFTFLIKNPWEAEESKSSSILKHHNPDDDIRRILAMLFQEFEGTFFITFIYGLSINASQSIGTLGIALMIISQVYAGVAVSGAHYNPCISLAVFIRSYYTNERMRLRDLGLFIVVQLSAAYAAVGIIGFINGGYDNLFIPAVNHTDHTNGQAFFMEFVFTAAVVMTVLFTTTSDNVKGNNFFGLAIGFMTMAGAFVSNNISGSIFNPAISLSLITVKEEQVDDLWVYIFGDISGTLLGVALYLFFSLESMPKSAMFSRKKRESSKSYTYASPLLMDEESVISA